MIYAIEQAQISQVKTSRDDGQHLPNLMGKSKRGSMAGRSITSGGAGGKTQSGFFGQQPSIIDELTGGALS